MHVTCHCKDCEPWREKLDEYWRAKDAYSSRMWQEGWLSIVNYECTDQQMPSREDRIITIKSLAKHIEPTMRNIKRGRHK